MPLKILILTDWYPSKAEPGNGIFVQDHARALSKLCDVAVVARQPKPTGFIDVALETDSSGPRCIARVQPRTVPSPGVGLLSAIGIKRAIGQLARQGFEPDLIHAHVYSAGLFGTFFSRIEGIPLVVSEHFSQLARGELDGFQEWKSRFVYRNADVVAPVSQSLAHEIKHLIGETEVVPIPNPVNSSLFYPRVRSSPRQFKPDSVLAVSSCTRVKGIDILLEAMSTILSSGLQLRLRVVGDGPLLDAHKKMASDLGIRSQVEFMGWQSRSNVAQLMRNSRLLVHPSRYETLGMVLIEAMACGLPIVSTRCGGPEETVPPEAGVLVPPEDPEELAEGILEVLSDGRQPPLVDVASQAINRYGYDAIAERWMKVYRPLVDA